MGLSVGDHRGKWHFHAHTLFPRQVIHYYAGIEEGICLKHRTENWLVPRGFATHWLTEMDPLISPTTGFEKHKDSIESVELIYAVLDLVSQSDQGAGVTEIAKTLNTSKARISRQLHAMAMLALVDRNEATRKYCLGAALVNWGVRGLRNRGLDERIWLAMHRLRESAGGKAVIFSILEKNWGRVCFSLTSTAGDPLSVPMGTPLIFPRSPSARVLWAYDPAKADLLRSKRATRLIEHTTFETLADLCASLKDTRRTGVAATLDVRLNNRGSAAAPVIGKSNELVGALAVVDFTNAITPEHLEKMTTIVKMAARDLSSILGAPREG